MDPSVEQRHRVGEVKKGFLQDAGMRRVDESRLVERRGWMV